MAAVEGCRMGSLVGFRGTDAEAVADTAALPCFVADMDWSTPAVVGDSTCYKEHSVDQITIVFEVALMV